MRVLKTDKPLLGVPADSLRVELGANPPHVALREGDRWVKPMDDEYTEIFQRRCPRAWQAWSYIAGGEILEAIGALALIVTLNFFGASEVAIVAAWAAAALFAVYVVADTIISSTRGQISGDWSAMFVVNRVAAITLAIALAAVKAAPIAVMAAGV